MRESTAAIAAPVLTVVGCRPGMETKRRARLTLKKMDALKPRRRDYYLWDEEVPQLAVRVYPSGTKVFLLRVSKHGRQSWHRLGRYAQDAAPLTPEMAARGEESALGPEQARREARRVLGLVAGGLDPGRARAVAKGIPTLAEFARRYVREVSDVRKRPASASADRGLLGIREPKDAKRRKILAKPRKGRRILPVLGAKRLDTITTADIEALMTDWRDTPVRANRARALLSHIFSTAAKWGLLSDGSNPARAAEKYRERGRERFLSANELASLGEALRRSANEEDHYALAAIKLLILTGARHGEILGARWADLDSERNSLTIHEPKEGRTKVLPLSPAARDVVKSLARLRDNPYLIAGRKPKAHFVGLEKVWQRVRTKAGLEGVRLHDLRHSFASLAAAGGASLVVIGSLLGHRSPTTTARYAHLVDEARRRVADAVGETAGAALAAGDGQESSS
jgi:integrase